MCLSFHFEERKSLLTFFQDYSFLKEVSVTTISSLLYLFIIALISNLIINILISLALSIFV